MSANLAAAFVAALDDEALDALAERLAPRLAVRIGAADDGAPWLTAAEAAVYIGAPSRRRVYDLAASGRLLVAYDGRRPRFRREWLDAYLRGRPA